jgi:hypothetical protein
VDMMDIRIRAKTASETSSAAEDYVTIMINLGGLLMEGLRPHQLESKLLLDMIFPENVRISLTGRVTSCHFAKSKDDLYDVGIEFVSMTETDRTKLKKFIHWLYLKDAGFTE